MGTQQQDENGDQDATPEPLLPRHNAGFVAPAARPTPPARPYGEAASGHRTASRPGDDGGQQPADYDTPGVTAAPGRHQPAPAGAFPGTERVDHERVLAGEGYTSAPPSNDPVAVAALVLGIAGLIPLVGIAGAVCGHLALRRLRVSYRGGAGLAVAGIVLGYTLTVLWVLFYLATRTLAA